MMDDIVIHVINVMYDSNWFSKDTMTYWEDILNKNKTWNRCQQVFEATYIARKRYMEAKGQKQEHANKIPEADL